MKPAEAVDSSDDLLREIFPRLRPQQLARFKLVCKRWKSLISDPDLHLNRPPKPAFGLICRNFIGSPFLVVPFDKLIAPKSLNFPNNHQPFAWFEIVHACNGLLLCYGILGGLDLRYFVLNPTTMQYATLPEPATMTVLGLCLAVDPSAMSLHYKVVCVSGISERGGRSFLYKQIEVYSSETRSWGIRMTNAESFRSSLDIEKGVYWNGAIHWIAKHWDFDSIYFNPDDDDDMHRVFPPPPTPCRSTGPDNIYTDYFGESCGHLHFFVYSRVTREATVYEMRRDYSEWFVKYKSRVSVFYGYFSVHALLWGKEDEGRFLVFDAPLGTTMVWYKYNIVSRELETLNGLMCTRSGVSLPYSESTMAC